MKETTMKMKEKEGEQLEIINIGERLGDSTLFKFIILISAFVASLIFAYLMYFFIEKPTQRLSKLIKYT